MIDEILNLAKRHEQWRWQRCVNLIPSENITSPQVRYLLSSELTHRYTSPDRFYMGTRFMDEIEACGEKIARKLFQAEIADLRPLSGHIADLIFLANFTEQSGLLMCVSAEDGGYPGIWKEGLPKVLGIKVEAFPFSKQKMNIKIEEAAEAIIGIKPKVVIFGASLFLFPHPVRKLAKMAKRVGAHVGFDGSHVMGLIAGGKFQNPLQEGASVFFGSTHKSFFGPQGGIILANKEHGTIIKENVHPTFVDNAHWNRIAALTLALAEMQQFGSDYAEQVIRNAQVLARTLDDYGFPVVGANLGYTKSHQVLLDYGGYKHGREVAKRLENANIIADCGVRLGTCEVTRRGMKETEMERIAEFIKHVVIDRKDSGKVKLEVEKLAKSFQSIEYCFSQ
ncbi:MAG: serine hydroxymethyltransferase [Candidatus Bathyarchaeia archaeon]